MASTMPGGAGYLDRVRAQVWDEFVRNVVAMLQCAAARVAADRPVAFSTRNGWWGEGGHRVLGHDVRIPLENAVTDALVRSCKDLLRRRRPNHFLVQKQIFVVQQQPREVQDRLGSAAYTTDIQFASSSVPDLDLRIEAKRLLGASHLGDYLGSEGLLRFAHREPYTVQPVGMMLGYVFQHDPAHWSARIDRQMPSSSSALQRLKVGRWNIPGGILGNPTVGDVLVLHLLVTLPSRPDARLLPQKPPTVRRRRAVPSAPLPE
ncbi:hypothetical protein [Sphingomonas sp. CLY1604]|uniref:hypothetical protein n=1 Tax=Sphingomonas sp. CLY1604 TaxID=3457786 RepID=UPI003FD7B481